mgnify:CR=1 FL=1
MQKKDFIIVTVIGSLIGIFALFPVKNIGAENGFFLTLPIGAAIVLGCAIFAPLALLVLKLLSKRVPVFEKFGKFAAVGTLNTVLDLSVLNVLAFVTGFSSGIPFFGFKATSFVFATTNSYFWNKFWTFQSGLPVSAQEYLRFGFFTLLGALLNATVASVVRMTLAANLPSGLAVNVAALTAVAASFLFNFLMYKNIVFKGSVQKSEPEAKDF